MELPFLFIVELVFTNGAHNCLLFAAFDSFMPFQVFQLLVSSSTSIAIKNVIQFLPL